MLEPEYPFVKIDVLLRGSGPGIVLDHAVALDCAPRLGLTIKVKGFAYFFKQRSGRVVVKLEAITNAAPLIKVFDRVVESTGGPHNRHRAVAHAVHLVQSTRFILRWHQEHLVCRLLLEKKKLDGITLVNADAERRRIMQRLNK